MIYDLVSGNSYQFEGVPINECAMGDGKITDDFADIMDDQYEQRSKEFHPKSTEEKPMFETKLNSRGLIVGYGRGHFSYF